MGTVIRLEHADLEFPGYYASVGAEVTGTGMVHLIVGSEPDDDDGNSAVIRIAADGAEELARALAERASVARRAAGQGRQP